MPTNRASRTFRGRRPIVLAAGIVLAMTLSVSFSGAQDRVGDGLSREQMWRAPTQEEWKRPVLITFQRTWEDALAVSKETGKPILVCINMDGEIASEHYAGVRYRQPEIAKLYEPYVSVIASTYRHNARDYDDQGRRILCPRFGSVTCGEHIAIEPILFEKFMDGQRISPRHIMVELDGTETYDVFYANDTASVFDAIRDGIDKRENQPTPVVRGDRSIIERVASRDIEDRRAVEAAYRDADEETRRTLLEAAAKQPDAVPHEILRLAVFGLDVDMSKLARSALANTTSPEATDLISEALRVPMEGPERDTLIAALERIGKTSDRAQWLAVVNRGLSGRSEKIDAGAWSKARAEYEAAATAKVLSIGELTEEQAGRFGRFREKPKDAAACIDLAEATLALGIKARKDAGNDPRMARTYVRKLLEHASQSARDAEALGAEPWRVNSVLALAAYYGGDRAEAYARAEAAMGDLPSGEPSWNTMVVLTLFAESRWESIKQAMDEKRRFPPQYFSDVNTTYAVLRSHPHGTDRQVEWHLNFLQWLGADRQVSHVLLAGLERFPGSSALHKRLRGRTLQTRGVDALEAVYTKMLEEKEPTPRLLWFAGYASTVAAEFHRRARTAGKALVAYTEAIDRFERAGAGDPRLVDSVDRRVALALAGRGRLAYDLGDDDRATADILASLARYPAAAGTTDGLGITPADSAQILLARLMEGGKTELATKLADAISRLDPELLPKD